MSVYGANTRDITFSCTSLGLLTYEAVEVAIARVRDMEELYFLNPTAVQNITNAKTVLTGKTPYKIFVFTVTTVMSTGAYTFVLDEIAPNTESLVQATSIDVTPISQTIAVAGTVQLVTAFTPANTSAKGLTYVSSVPAKATVSATGLVTGVATGTTTITITSAYGLTDTVAITVS